MPANPKTFSCSQPGTVALPIDGTSTLVFRFSNPHAEGLNNKNRVENIVISQHLAHSALLAAGQGPLVPAIYAWGPCRYPEVPDESGFGWILDEFKTGSDLDSVFDELSWDEKQAVIGAIADMLTALQQAPIPANVVDKFGSMTFGKEGQVVPGEMPLLEGGPWSSYAALWAARMRLKLENADNSSVLNGWRANGVRERIENFITQGGIDKLLDGVDTQQKVLVHGDFSECLFLFTNVA